MLVSTVELAWRARRGAELGLAGAAGVGLDWGEVIARKNRIVASWSQGKDQALERQGIAVLRGHATFLAPHELQVGDRTVTTEKIVIATGSSPARPSIEGIEHTVTSEELLDRTALPGRMVAIGGGAIGMELGFAFARAGLYTNVSVRRITGDRTVEADIGGTTHRLSADVVVVATGRPPNTEGLRLDLAGVRLERGTVSVNEYLQSPTAPHVYAAGDVTGRHQHTPAAWYEGRVAAENALKGNHEAVDFNVFPTTIFTIPAVAQVGLTEAEARKRGLRVGVGRSPFEDNTAASVREETEGLVKVIYDEASGQLLGVHILGPNAEDLIHIAAVAMRGGLRRRDLAGMHYVFPTLAGTVFDAMWE
ncbi:MAG: NAD(P)/FAD-dependent oxidoreductase [Candidatus Rokubacteria bacterium]|nr:NAD(P)/FAD-dependent oxidoreductase [Candidatus Rokubacteria bacterium]